MASSALEAISESIVAELLLVDGLTSAKEVPFSKGLVFRESEDGAAVLDYHEPPDTYPGAVVMINDRAIDSTQINQQYGGALVKYRAPLSIVFYATSDGSSLMGAVRAAWALYEAALRRLCVFTPTGMPAGAQALAPVKPDDFTSITIDANTHAIAALFWAEYQIEVTA